MDWQSLLVPHNVLENVVRATATFWLVYLLLRFLPNRKTGGIGQTDLLVLLLLANAMQLAMMRDATAITDGAILVVVIMGWSLLVDAIGDRFPALRTVLRSAPMEVVRDGKVLTRNLRREFMTEDELDAQLRLQGVDAVDDVARAFVEHDGRISVIRKRDEAPRKQRTTTPKKRSAA
jgi:uncharacterized membrane protein YcaP (DUF421 family)